MRNNTMRPDSNSIIQASFHKNWLTTIKKELGGKCNFISHVQKNDEYYLKVVLVNPSGGKDTVTYKLKGAPHTLNSNDYHSLLQNLKNGEYEQRSTDTLPEPTGE